MVRLLVVVCAAFVVGGMDVATRVVLVDDTGPLSATGLPLEPQPAAMTASAISRVARIAVFFKLTPRMNSRHSCRVLV